MSTARALSLSTSPSDTPSPSSNNIRPPWRNPQGSRRNSARHSSRNTATLRDQIINRASSMSRRFERAWQKMNVWQKIGAVFASLGAIALGLGFMFFTGKVFIWLAPVAEEWEKSKLAYFILWLCVFFVSFPPLVGWSTFGTVSGYIFGIWKG